MTGFSRLQHIRHFIRDMLLADLWQCAPHQVHTGPHLFCHLFVQELNAQGLSNLMHAYATLGAMPKRLTRACAHELNRRLPCPSFTLQDLGTLLWSLCIFEVRLPICSSSRTVSGWQ